MKMLLKYSVASKKIRGNNNGKLGRNSSGVARGVGPMSALQRHRKVLNRTRVVAKREIPRPQHDPCDNSNDSGLGFDHHPVETQQLGTLSHFNFPNQQPHKACWAEEPPDLKRRRPCDVTTACDSDNANADFTFPLNPPAPLCSSVLVATASSTSVSRPLSYSVVGGGVNGRVGGRRTYGKRLNNIAHSTHMCSSVQDPKVYLEIVCQPEQQHRARYQTEGSRGAVKDRSGNGFPVVKLCGYLGQATLEVFIGTDQGKIAPHMFYQACRVAGKNSTPCLEKKQDGTVIIDIDFEPGKEMAVTCDCVGILKERNVDVEQRFPDESTARSKKKSTRCRMVFRTTITNPVTGETEMLQVASQPIVCTQPPGVPEICKKNISSCPVTGGEELWIFGKNFLKDTKVVFQRTVGEHCLWEQSVTPDKEYLQQIHLVCKVPPYEHQDIKEPVTVSVKVVSSNRHSEPQVFVYTPDTSQLWPTLGTSIKTEHLMPPPTLVSVNPHYMSTGGKQIETAPLSKGQNLDAIVNSAADSHILSSQTPTTDSTNTQLLPQVTSLLTESSSQQQQIESQVRSLLTEPSICTQQEQQQLVSQVSSLLDEAANTQQQMVSQVSSLVIEAAHNQQQQLVSEVNSLLTEAANTQQQQQLVRSLLSDSCTKQGQQQIESQVTSLLIEQEQMNNMITKPTDHLLLQEQELTYPPTSTTASEQQQLFDQINLLQVQSQIQNMNESAAQQIMQNMNETSPPQLLQSMVESNPQQLMQGLNESSPQQIMQTLSESTSPQQLMQNIAESNTQQIIQSLSESSSPQQIMQSLSEASSPQHLMQSPQQIMQSLSEASSPQHLMQSPQQIMQSLSEASSPQHLMQSPQQIMQSLSEASSPQHLMQSSQQIIPSPQQIMQSLSGSASPEQLMQTQQIMQSLSGSASPEQLMQSLSESSSPHHQQLMQSLTESSSPQLMRLGNSSPQQLIQTSSPQHQQLMQSSQQMMQTLSESNTQQMIQTVTESSPQQLMQSMTDTFSRPSSSQCSTEASPQLPFSRAMEDSNSQSALSIAPDETSQHLLMKKQEDNLNFMQHMIQKSEDLNLQQNRDSTVQDMLLMSMPVTSSESKLSTELLNYMTNGSDKATDLKLQFSEAKNLMLSEVRPEGNIQFSTANNPVSSGDTLDNLIASSAAPSSSMTLSSIMASSAGSPANPMTLGSIMAASTGSADSSMTLNSIMTSSTGSPTSSHCASASFIVVPVSTPRPVSDQAREITQMTQMSENDLLRFINPETFNNV